jgi:regulator of sigma E protease
MLTAIVFIITLAILIFVHELGHFLVARRNGIKADEFGFGFPPRIFGYVKVGKKWKFIRGNKEIESKNTIYSINWIPLGGFVKIKGENGDVKDKDSFAVKSAWTRIKVLAAGVTMNFVLAWFVISLAFMIGIPQAADSGTPAKNSVVQISQVLKETPAEKMGIRPGDQIVKCVSNDSVCKNKFANVAAVQTFISANKGKEIILEIKRGNETLNLKGTPRIDYPDDQGALGISLAETAIVSYPWFQAIYEGLMMTFRIVILIVTTFYDIIKSLLVGQKVAVDVTGPIGIAVVAKQFTDLGFVYILQFIALLSINLGIINALPFPALDGGRILFILIEKIKGSPVSQKVEQMIHNFGFMFLILLMILVTFHDVLRFGIIDKIKGIF